MGGVLERLRGRGVGGGLRGLQGGDVRGWGLGGGGGGLMGLQIVGHGLHGLHAGGQRLHQLPLSASLLLHVRL